LEYFSSANGATVFHSWRCLSHQTKERICHPNARDLANLETHLPDTGHFALEMHGEEIASRVEGFFSKNKITR